MNNDKALVLVVDDTPDTLALLHDRLADSGYTVLAATNGKAAIKICQEVSPDIVLLDAVMPEMDGFEVCKHLKQDSNTHHIPVIFMTGLTETEHVVAGFTAGGIDYVTKPLDLDEVLARLSTHIGNARVMSRTQSALDAFGQAVIALTPNTNNIIWQTPLSRRLFNKYLEKDEDGSYDLAALSGWIKQISETKGDVKPHKLVDEKGTLVFSVADIHSEEQWLVLIKEESESNQIQALKEIFNLTKRESEVLHWATMGKTDKIIGQILGTSPRTVNKHMEHVLIKLGVESRTAAAAIAMNKLLSLRG